MVHIDQMERLLGSPQRVIQITPDDNNDLARVIRALWIVTGGDVAFIAELDETTNVIPYPDNTLLVCSIRRILATDTTATGMWGYI